MLPEYVVSLCSLSGMYCSEVVLAITKIVLCTLGLFREGRKADSCVASTRMCRPRPWLLLEPPRLQRLPRLHLRLNGTCEKGVLGSSLEQEERVYAGDCGLGEGYGPGADSVWPYLDDAGICFWDLVSCYGCIQAPSQMTEGFISVLLHHCSFNYHALMSY